ncbi:MAG TPA: chloride channel protein [Vicinamibacterales bacterium]|nr:chloride channel protein [Vicinamibacterales bacterium]
MRPLSYQQLRLREHQLFLVLSIVVGVLAGLSAVLFTLAIDGTARLLFGIEPSGLRLFAVPAAVSLLTGILLLKVFPDVRGSGVPQTKAAFQLSSGIISPRVPIGKFLTATLCIGSGHSMGREGPSVQIGAGIASGIGQWLRLAPARIRELVPVGAAGALSAAFNTPVAAVVFALEEIISDLNAPLLGSTVVASVASVVVARSILGNEPLFRVPAYHLVHPAELIGYAVLGLVGGLVSIAFCKGLLLLRRAFRHLPPRTQIVQPAIGGLVIGAILLAVPEVRGVGYEHVDQALNGGLLLQTMVVLCLVKLVATIVSYSSGNAGGIFAPSLFIGAMAGGAVGVVINQAALFPAGDPGAYALVGMGTLFAGIIRAPMTSVFMIFEITQDYQIIVPLMVANLLSFAISRRYQPVPVYHALLQQDGVHLPPRALAIEPSAWTARDLMTGDMPFVARGSTARAGLELARASGHPACLVGTPKDLAGTVTVEHLLTAVASGQGDQPIDPLVDGTLVHAHPDHPVDVVLERFSRTAGLLPIVSRDDARQVEGVIVLRDIRRLVANHRAEAGGAPMSNS